MLTEELRGWLAGRLPEGLFTEIADLVVDREEITIVGRIGEPELDESAGEAERQAAREGRVAEFRERTREQRMAVAREAERRFERKVSWGVECGPDRAVFTNVSAPVMTRLRQPERRVLDLLVEGGVARSRSDALLWCVRLVEQHADEWLSDLRDSLEHVRKVRANAPNPPSG